MFALGSAEGGGAVGFGTSRKASLREMEGGPCVGTHCTKIRFFSRCVIHIKGKN